MTQNIGIATINYAREECPALMKVKTRLGNDGSRGFCLGHSLHGAHGLELSGIGPLVRHDRPTNYCRNMIRGSALSGTSRHCALSSA